MRVKDFAAWALVGRISFILRIMFVYKRYTAATAFAVYIAPDMILRALLPVAGALALFGVPVVGVVYASLWSTYIIASI